MLLVFAFPSPAQVTVSSGGTGTVANTGASGQILIGQGNSTFLEKALSGDCTLAATGAISCTGLGSAVTFDIGDDGGNDSTDVNEIATTGDTASIFTECAADKLCISVGNAWPTATALAANGANCGAGNYPLGVDASGAAETCTADDDTPDNDGEVPDGITLNMGTGSIIGLTGSRCLETSAGGAVQVSSGPCATGTSSVAGSGSSTDQGIARWVGTGGTQIEDSGCSIDDTGNLDCLGSVEGSCTPASNDCGVIMDDNSGDHAAPGAGLTAIYSKSGAPWTRAGAAGAALQICLSDGTGCAAGSTEVQDEAYSSANFNADTTHAVSQDDLYDLIHAGDADDDGKPDIIDSATNGFVKTSGGTGAVSIDTNTYLTAEVDGSTTNEIEVVDEAYSAGNFNGGTTSAVSQDDLYDLIHAGDADDDGKPDVLDSGTNGFVKTSGGTGAISIDTNTYLTAEVDGSTSNEIEVVDEAYSAANFNGGTTSAVSQDDLYDLIHAGDADDDGIPDLLDTTATGTTPSADDNDTSVATTAYVQTELNAAGGRSLSCASGSCDADAELYTRTKSMTIETPASADDLIFYRVAQAATISSINCLAIGGTSAVITLNECDTAGASCAGVDGATTITCGTTATADDGALSNAGIDATDVMRIDVGTVTGSVTQLMVSITYTEND